MRIAVVILNWNTEGFLRKFLPPLLDSMKKAEGAEVIVADNDSTDESLQVMKGMFPQVKVLAFESNLGFTGGYNRAFREIKEYGNPEYFVLINSDIEVTENWLQPLTDWMDRHPECGACAPKLHSWQDRDSFEYAGAAGGYIDRYGYPFCRGRVLGKLERDKGQYDKESNRVFWASGACLMVRSEVYERLGGLDERFFAHMEEIDLCWRMQLEGYSICIVPESTVYHVGGGTLPSSSPFKLYLNYRNNHLMLENNLAKTYALMHYDGKDADKAAVQGIRDAEMITYIRRLMDWMSAIVYLVTFRIKEFKAVFKAHKDAKEMRKEAEEVSEYLERAGKASVQGIYGKWIVMQSLLKGDSIFADIKEKDFLKFEKK